MKAKYAAMREAAYQQGLAEAPELLKDETFRDFVVLYMGEGYRKNRNVVDFVNSNVQMVRLAYRWMYELSSNKEGFSYWLQCHVDHGFFDHLRSPFNLTG